MRAAIYWAGFAFATVVGVLAGIAGAVFYFGTFWLTLTEGGLGGFLLVLLLGPMVIGIAVALLTLPARVVGAALMAISGYDPEA